MTRLIVSALFASVVFATGCNQSPIDGGWEGVADCEAGEDLTVEAVLDQRLEHDDVKGSFFIEYNIDFGILGLLRVWERGEVQDGEWDSQNLEIQGEITADDTGDGEPAPNWVFRLELTDDELTTLEGSFDRINGNGDVINACDLQLDKVNDPEN